MGATTLLLAITSILAVTPEIFGANRPGLCEYPPVYSFTYKPQTKWGYYPAENRCKVYHWDDRWGSFNVFDTEQECIDTCRALPANTVEGYLVAGHCECDCPECDVVTTTESVPMAPSTLAPATTTENTMPPVTSKAVESTPNRLDSADVFLDWLDPRQRQNMTGRV